MTKKKISKVSKTRRTYDLPDDVLPVLDELSDKGYAKERVVAAGVLLFSAAPADLQSAGLDQDRSKIDFWYALAFEAWAVALAAKIRHDSQDGGQGRSVRQG